jgi:hypothetical protein
MAGSQTLTIDEAALLDNLYMSNIPPVINRNNT